MSREIKFRAWIHEEMYYSDKQTENENGMICWELDVDGVVVCCIPEMSFRESGGEAFEEIRYIEYKEVEQYTGLKDKNGREIYEGDIVSHVGPIGFINSKVHFAKGVFCLDLSRVGILGSLPMSTEAVKVIGNIHENKNLLEL